MYTGIGHHMHVVTDPCACKLGFTDGSACMARRCVDAVADVAHALEFCAASCAYSCSAHFRPCAQGRCGRCTPGSGVMSEFFFCFFLFLECVHLRDTRALTYVHMYIHLWCGPWGSCELDGLRILQVYHALCMRLEL